MSPGAARIRETIALVTLSSVYSDDACTARVVSSGGQLEYKVILLRDLETNTVWGACDCKWWRSKGSVTYQERFCKHLVAAIVTWDRELHRSKKTGASPSHAKA